jgi:hypothetical protein
MSTEEKLIFETLYMKHKKVAISKKEMAQETGQSVSTLDRLRRNGLGCAYMKHGNGDIFYPLYELAGYNGELGHQRQKHLDTLVGDIFRI